MIARVGTFRGEPDFDVEELHAFMRTQVGCRDVYALRSRDASKLLSVGFWDDEQAMKDAAAALADEVLAGRLAAAHPDVLEIFDVTDA